MTARERPMPRLSKAITSKSRSSSEENVSPGKVVGAHPLDQQQRLAGAGALVIQLRPGKLDLRHGAIVCEGGLEAPFAYSSPSFVWHCQVPCNGGVSWLAPGGNTVKEASLAGQRDERRAAFATAFFLHLVGVHLQLPFFAVD